MMEKGGYCLDARKIAEKSQVKDSALRTIYL